MEQLQFVAFAGADGNSIVTAPQWQVPTCMSRFRLLNPVDSARAPAPALRRNFDVLDLTRGCRNGVPILAHTFQMKGDGLSNFGFDLSHGSK